MKKTVISILLFSYTVSALFAYSKITAQNTKVFTQGLININQCSMYISNFGVLGSNSITGENGFYYPAGYPNETYISGAGMWLGALVDTGFVVDGNDTIRLYDTLVTCGYNPGDGVTEFVPGDIIDSVPDSPGPYENEWDRVYLSNTDNEGYQWPIRTASDGDSVLSDQDSYCEYNDKEASRHFETESQPLYVEVHQTTYCWSDSMNENIVYLKFDIRNDRADKKTLEKCFFAMSADNDIGNESGDAANDLLGFIDTMTVDYNGVPDTLMQINLAYQFQLDAESEWTHTPAIIAYKFIGTPASEEPVDLYHNGSYVVTPGNKIGMTTFSYFTIANDPATKEARYQVLAGYDQTIFDPDDPEASFSPFPVWGVGVAGYPGQTQNPLIASDKRFIMSSGSFNIENRKRATVVMAIIIAPTKEDILQMALYSQHVYDSLIYYGIFENDSRENKTKNPKMSVPSILLSKQSMIIESETAYDINLYDMSGRILKTDATFTNRGNTISYTVDLNNISNGVYLLNMKNGSENYSKKIVILK